MSRIEDDLRVAKNLSCLTFTPPSGCIGDAAVAAGANLQTGKMQHKHRKSYFQAGAASSLSVPIHVVSAAVPLDPSAAATAEVLSLRAGSIVACGGNATITIDLKKNGTSLLTAPLVLNGSSTARTAYAAALGDGSLLSGDWLEIVVTASAGSGTLGSGLLLQLEVDENAQ